MIRPEDIRDLLRKQPFQSFRMHMSNGHFYDVTHPELAVVTRATIVVAKANPSDPDAVGEGFHLVSVLHVNNIEFLPSNKSASKA